MRRFILGAFSSFTLVVLSVASAPGCGSDSDDDNPGSSGGNGDGGACTGFGCTNSEGGKPGCIGLECKQVGCDQPGTTTTLSGTVTDPAGKVPIFNATVYVPNAAVDPLTTGASCDRCDAKVSGNPVVITATDTDGKFKLENVPVGDQIPLVIQLGKWRRQVVIPTVASCVDTPVDAGMTHLPRNKAEGDIPRIAMVTGAADPLQCLLRKMGIDDKEFNIKGSDARVHLYQGGGYDTNVAANKLADNTAFTSATDLWSNLEELKKYDMVVMACEGTENDDDTHKPAASKQALYDYAKLGGRVFTTHYHHTFFSSANAPADVQGVATWEGIPEPQPPALPSNPATTPVNADIVGTFEKALKMKEWLTKQNALPGGKLPLVDARDNVEKVTADKALDWIELTNPNNANKKAVQYMTFNAPVGAPEDKICGRVVFSDLHVGAGTPKDEPTSAEAFPTGCHSTELSAQQKALEFMLFDLSSCIQKDDSNIEPPR